MANIDPGAGYRLLNYGEWIEEGDEIFQDYGGGKWTRTKRIGLKNLSSVRRYRRKISPQPLEPTMPQVIKDRLEKSKTLWTEIQRLTIRAQDMIRAISNPDDFIVQGEVARAPNLETEKRIAGTIRRFAQEQLDEIELALQVVVEDYRRAGIPVQGEVGVTSSEPSRSAEKYKLNEFVEIDPGEGYRLLSSDEIVQKGDEYFDGRYWDRSGRPGVSVRELTEQYPTVARAYRRKVGNEQLST